ncbi:hypothetical protein [Nocardia sp. NRRL S-836]|nr:hypothetical protein [Nocardia sp. NRRL S-836]
MTLVNSVRRVPRVTSRQAVTCSPPASSGCTASRTLNRIAFVPGSA